MAHAGMAGESDDPGAVRDPVYVLESVEPTARVA